jgi:Putative zinc-finger
MSHLDEGQLHALLDGELDEAERREVESHLAACAECQQLYEEARAFLAEADELIAEVQVPPMIRPEARPPVLEPRRTGRRLPWNYLAWAATVVLAVGLGWYGSEFRYRAAAQPVDALADKSVAPSTSAAPEGRAASEAAAKQEVESPSRRNATRLDSVSRSIRPEPAPSAAAAAPAPARTESGEAQAAAGAPAAAPPAGHLPFREALQERDAPAAPPAQPLLAEGKLGGQNRLDQAPSASEPPAAAALAVRKTAPATGLRPVDLATAVRMLGGTIRLVDGLTPTRVLAGPGGTVPGADPQTDLIRVVYEDPPGRELWLDLQRTTARDEDSRHAYAARAATALLPGDDLTTPIAGGARSLRWLDQGGFQLGLTGFLPADSLRALANRVQ